MSRHFARRLLSLLAGAFSFTGSTASAEPIRVELKSGRVYTAEVDARTTDERLWLRFGENGAFLFRPIAWDRIARAERQGAAIPVNELRRLAPELATTVPHVQPLGDAPQIRPIQSATKASLFPATPAERSQIVSVQFDALLANWDADVEADGLVVRLWPLADDGGLAQVGGTLEVNLVSVVRRDFNQTPDRRGRAFEQIGRWSVAVSAAEIGPSGAVLRLPFQAVHPEFDAAVAPYGLVHLRYSAAGHGVFEASQDVVRIRPFAPLRDALQQSGQDRFLPLERRGR